MAGPGGKFLLKQPLGKPMAHHASFKALWETKWKEPCEMGVYPFMFASINDFQPVVDQLIKKVLKEPYDWDAYAETFFPKAEELLARAQAGEAEGNSEKASELYLRASAMYRIARFPYPQSDKQREAWEKNKNAARKGLALRGQPTFEVLMPHTHGTSSEGRHLPGFYHLPSFATASNKVPLMIMVTGLDGYRTDLVVMAQGWHDAGCAFLVVEIPGTGDNPADKTDPAATDRVWDSMFEWVGAQKEIDQSRVAAHGVSTGGYYVIRMAHTHASKLVGVACQGGGCHHMFDSKWLDASEHLEYPFPLGSTLMLKFGYTDFEKFKSEAQAKYSLVNDGTLDKPGHARLLLVDGSEDSVFPTDDLYVACQHGDPKDLRVFEDMPHMGEPNASYTLVKWMFERLGLKADPAEFLKAIPTKTKY